jgi:hypothetical protein
MCCATRSPTTASPFTLRTSSRLTD